MIDLYKNKKILGDIEVLMNAINYIKKFYRENFWADYAKVYYKVLAHAIGWHPDEVKGFFKAHGINMERKKCQKRLNG